MNSTLRKIGLMAIAAQLALPSVALATNGYSAHGFGTKSKAMGGAGVAVGLDALTAGTNPAGMGLLGNRFDLGVAVFAPHRGFTAADDGAPPPNPSIPPGHYDSDHSVFVVPSFGVNWRLNELSTVGISLAGNGGMNTTYNARPFSAFAPPANLLVDAQGNPIGFDPNPSNPQPNNVNPGGVFTPSEPTGIDLAQLFLGLSYTYKILPNHILGIMPFLAVQRFKARGLEPFRQQQVPGFGSFTIDPSHVTNNGYDYSYGGGVRVGWVGEFTDQLNVGVSYQTRAWMTKFDDYRGLFAGEGSFDIPPTIVAGFAYKVTPKLMFLFDYQRIFYGDIKALNNSNSGFSGPLGSDEGLGFGWDDQNIYKLGVSYDYNDNWTLRAGYSHADEPFAGSQALFNILAPATVVDHVTAGFTRRLDDSNEINFSLMRALYNKIPGTNPTFTGPQTGFVWMDQWEAELSWGHKF